MCTKNMQLQPISLSALPRAGCKKAMRRSYFRRQALLFEGLMPGGALTALIGAPVLFLLVRNLPPDRPDAGSGRVSGRGAPRHTFVPGLAFVAAIGLSRGCCEIPNTPRSALSFRLRLGRCGHEEAGLTGDRRVPEDADHRDVLFESWDSRPARRVALRELPPTRKKLVSRPSTGHPSRSCQMAQIFLSICESGRVGAFAVGGRRYAAGHGEIGRHKGGRQVIVERGAGPRGRLLRRRHPIFPLQKINRLESQIPNPNRQTQ